MRKPNYFAGSLGLALAVLLFAQGTLIAQGAPRELSSDDVTVQTRGPVHEAYAQPVDVSPRPGAIISKKPPDPIAELPPEQKPQGDNVIWIPGYWSWDQEPNDFSWVSGFWRVPPPNRKWVPGHWAQADDGSQWIAGFWAPNTQREIQYVQQPPATLDRGPSVPAPDDTSNYVPGCWIYGDEGWVWRPGYWLEEQPGYVWTSAHYCYTPSGYTYVSGYWDYPLEDRGLLFAPVCFNRPFWETADCYYRPSYCVPWYSLLSSLFIRPSYCQYYFGDYYGADYLGGGFNPWYDYGRRSYDPLFGYYRWANRGDPGWYSGLASTYRARLNGDLARPPRTLAAQNRLLANNRGDAGSLALVTPLSQFHNRHLPLTKLSQNQVATFRQQGQQVRELSQGRQAQERPGHTLVHEQAGAHPNNTPQYAHGSMLTSPIRVLTPSHDAGPARPQRPQVVRPAEPTRIVPPSHVDLGRHVETNVVRPTEPSRSSGAPVIHTSPAVTRFSPPLPHPSPARPSAPPSPSVRPATHSAAPPPPAFSRHGGGSTSHGGGGHGGGSHKH